MVLIVYPPSRSYCFPPAPPSLIDSNTGGLQKPPAGVLGSDDTMTGAPEKHEGEAVEQEAHSFVTSISTLVISTAAGKHPQGDPEHDKSTNTPDPTEITADVAHAKDKSNGDEPTHEHDRTKEPVSRAVWSQARPVMHAMADFVDTWERFGNALNATPPFPRQTRPLTGERRRCVQSIAKALPSVDKVCHGVHHWPCLAPDGPRHRFLCAVVLVSRLIAIGLVLCVRDISCNLSRVGSIGALVVLGIALRVFACCGADHQSRDTGDETVRLLLHGFAFMLLRSASHGIIGTQNTGGRLLQAPRIRVDERWRRWWKTITSRWRVYNQNHQEPNDCRYQDIQQPSKSVDAQECPSPLLLTPRSESDNVLPEREQADKDDHVHPLQLRP